MEYKTTIPDGIYNKIIIWEDEKNAKFLKTKCVIMDACIYLYLYFNLKCEWMMIAICMMLGSTNKHVFTEGWLMIQLSGKF